ncbi:MAG: hypothetical protein PVJ06_14820 [Desulfobacterales bacterium]|jgi:hypothetical protein
MDPIAIKNGRDGPATAIKNRSTAPQRWDLGQTFPHQYSANRKNYWDSLLFLQSSRAGKKHTRLLICDWRTLDIQVDILDSK